MTRDHALSIYIPKGKAVQKPLERLTLLAKRKDRSVNYLIVEAILEFLDRAEEA